MSIFFWGYSTTQILGGAAADLFGGCYTIAISSFLWGSICLLTPLLAHSSFKLLGPTFAFSIIVFLRFLMGMAQGLHFPSLSSLLSQRCLETNKSFSMAVVTSGSQVGTLACGLFGTILLNNYGWETVFVLFGILGIGFSIFIISLNRKTLAKNPKDFELEENSKTALLGKQKSNLPGLGHYRTNKHNYYFEIFTKLINSTKTSLSASKPLFSNKSFIALVLAHMAHTNYTFILSFWLPKFFHDTFSNSTNKASWQNNVIPWVGVIPGAVCAGILSDFLIRRSTFSLTSVRRGVEVVALVGSGLFLWPLASSTGLLANGSVESVLFLISVSISLSNFHSASVMVNPQDLAPKYAGSVFGIVNMMGAFSSAFGIWFSGYLLDIYNRQYTYIFKYITLLNLSGGLIFGLLATGKRLI